MAGKAATKPDRASPIRRLALVKMVGLAVLSIALLTGLLAYRSASLQHHEAQARMAEAARSLAAFVETHVDIHRRALQMAALSIQDGHTDWQQAIDRLPELYPGLLSVLVADDQGRITALAIRAGVSDVEPGELIGQSVADRHYFVHPRDQRKPFVSPVFKGRGVGEDWIVALSVPLLSPRGEFSGIIEGSLDLTAVGDRAQGSTSLTQVGYSVRDALGVAVFHRAAGGETDLPARSVTAKTRDEWTVSLTLPASYARELVAGQVRFAALIGVLVLMLSVWMAWLLARQISRPIEALTRATGRYKPGMNLPFAGLVEAAPAEVRSLGSSFESLTQDLANSLVEKHRLLQEQSRLHRVLEGEVLDRESIIEERTRALERQNIELKRLAKEAREAARSKTVFLATMSHELRTPLAAVVGFAELLERRAERASGERGELEASLLENARRLRDTINSVLEISALEDGEVILSPEPVNLVRLLTAVRKEHLFAVRQKSLRLELHTEAVSVVPIHTDPARLREVIDQIVGNAIKFTDQGRIDITAAASQSDGGWTIEIRDTGQGFSEKEIERVCEPFYQVDQTDNRRHGGVGLGLSIAAGLCRLMGLGLEIQSRIGEGTVVRIRTTGTDGRQES